jgi:hypothetical protein
MNAVMRSLVAILTKGNTKVVQALLDMVGITRAGSATDPAGKVFDLEQIRSLFRA